MQKKKKHEEKKNKQEQDINIKEDRKNSTAESIKKTAKALWNMTPIILGTVMLISLLTAIIPKRFYTAVFTGNSIVDSIIGTSIGSISAGNPITSYILGGELLKQGVSLVAVTAFLIAWVTVGAVQFPAEATILGKKFAILRNLTAIVLAVIAAIITILILSVI